MFWKYLEPIFAPFRKARANVNNVKNIKGNIKVDVKRAQGDTDTVDLLDSLPIVGSKKKDKSALATATACSRSFDSTSAATARARRHSLSPTLDSSR